MQQPLGYSELGINHDPPKRLYAAFLLKRASDMLDHVLSFVGLRLSKQG